MKYKSDRKVENPELELLNDVGFSLGGSASSCLDIANWLYFSTLFTKMPLSSPNRPATAIQPLPFSHCHSATAIQPLPFHNLHSQAYMPHALTYSISHSCILLLNVDGRKHHTLRSWSGKISSPSAFADPGFDFNEEPRGLWPSPRFHKFALRRDGCHGRPRL
jgi:hypothetical protein